MDARSSRFAFTRVQRGARRYHPLDIKLRLFNDHGRVVCFLFDRELLGLHLGLQGSVRQRKLLHYESLIKGAAAAILAHIKPLIGAVESRLRRDQAEALDGSRLERVVLRWDARQALLTDAAVVVATVDAHVVAVGWAHQLAAHGPQQLIARLACRVSIVNFLLLYVYFNGDNFVHSYVDGAYARLRFIHSGFLTILPFLEERILLVQHLVHIDVLDLIVGAV